MILRKLFTRIHFRHYWSKACNKVVTTEKTEAIKTQCMQLDIFIENAKCYFRAGRYSKVTSWRPNWKSAKNNVHEISVLIVFNRPH